MEKDPIHAFDLDLGLGVVKGQEVWYVSAQKSRMAPDSTTRGHHWIGIDADKKGRGFVALPVMNQRGVVMKRRVTLKEFFQQNIGLDTVLEFSVARVDVSAESIS